MIVSTSIVAGLQLTEHLIDAPLDHASPGGETIQVFACEVVDAARAGDDLPFLLFLQGGPGGASPRPLAGHPWIRVALERFRVVLLDQRGTGRSSRVTAASVRHSSPEAAAARLAHFRADAIVRDAELLRQQDFGGAQWITLGQSFGGFITLSYLSIAPEGLAACLVTGGLPSLRPDAAEVYRRTYPRAVAKNRRFAERYPQDAAIVARIADRLAARDVLLPDGDVLSVERFQLLGGGFGMSTGYDRLHELLETALDDDGEPSDAFLASVQQQTGYAEGPLYAVLQEACYGDAAAGPTAWAAAAEHASRPEFATDARPLLFTGETMFPWMFDDIRLLRPFREATHLLAAKADWPALYDPARLANNTVPVEAAVYFDDLYVDAALQLQTAAEVGNVHAWVTNEYEHDGLRADERVLRHLLTLLDDRGWS